jgi:hypothetical protein
MAISMHNVSHTHVRSLGSDWLRHRVTFEINEHIHSFSKCRSCLESRSNPCRNCNHYIESCSSCIDAAIVIHALTVPIKTAVSLTTAYSLLRHCNNDQSTSVSLKKITVADASMLYWRHGHSVK